MADEEPRGCGGCLLVGFGMLCFLPGILIAGAIWPDQPDFSDVVWRGLLIGLGLVVVYSVGVLGWLRRS